MTNPAKDTKRRLPTIITWKIIMKPILLSLFSISMLVSGCDDFEDESIDRCAGASAIKFDVNDELGREIAAKHAVRMAKKGCDYDAFYND